ncbi:MAG TPA: methylated-DNA--[protein]-cysteine S-methyltransferase [Haliangium sp.]|nr:methylated-DNA--[protein]-cysteine S-methyltransferase [Haliangium sp.]
MRYTILESPIGNLVLAGDDAGLRHILFSAGDIPSGWTLDPASLAAARQQIAEYFAGMRQVFDLPLAPAGTPFQQRVWRALVEIPYGRTASYGALAQRIGTPGAARAVGLANNRNPLPIVIPCHRVIGANGSLTGYAGGLHVKEHLLALEGARSSVQPMLL